MNSPTSVDHEYLRLYQFLLSGLHSQELHVESGVHEDNSQTGSHQPLLEEDSSVGQRAPFFPFSEYPIQPVKQDLTSTVSGSPLTFTPAERIFEPLFTVIASPSESEASSLPGENLKAGKRKREKDHSKQTVKKVQLTAEEKLQRNEERKERNRLSAKESRKRVKELMEKLKAEQEEFLTMAKQAAQSQAKTYQEKFPQTALLSFKTFTQNESEKESVGVYRRYLSHMIETLISEALNRQEQASAHIAQLEERIRKLEDAANLRLSIEDNVKMQRFLFTDKW
jgi:hypothetical protein